MTIKAALFDLDGTLLPMDQEEFAKGYFKLLVNRLMPLGYEPQELVAAVWKGTGAMINNDGSMINEDRFWECFKGIFSEAAIKDKPYFDEFYYTDFNKAKAFCGFDPRSSEAVRAIKAMGYRTILATNPIFPSVATEKRISWAGLEPSDFEFYTTYENSHFCKPSLDYYREVLSRAGLCAEECLMVGNDVGEDMIAEQLGMKVFLVTNCLINRQDKDISVYPSGDFQELLRYAEGLNN